MRRNRARQRGYLQRYTEEQPPSGENVARRHESADYLRYLLALLPAPQQLVLILAELEGFTLVEIAETLSIPAGTVHSRLRAAKQQLARVVEQEREREGRSDP